MLGIPRRSPWQMFCEKPLEWFLTAMQLGWFVTMMVNGDTLTRQYFLAFVKLGLTEQTIMGVCAFVGAFRAGVLIMNGNAPRGPLLRQVASVASAVCWVQVAIAFLLTTLQPPHLALSPAVAVYSLAAFAEILSVGVAANDERYPRKQH